MKYLVHALVVLVAIILVIGIVRKLIGLAIAAAVILGIAAAVYHLFIKKPSA
jgi:peptidoglycan/LPS O-acetylase OafA/YrhL